MRGVRLQFESLGELGSKSWRKQPPIFFQKKWGSVFFNFLIQALLRPQIAIRRRANISRVIFSWFWPLKIKISGKKLYGHNPLGMLNHIGFQNLGPFKSKYLTTITEAITLWGLLTILVFKMYNRLNTGLKIDTKRMRVCKNAKYIITSLSFAQFRNSRYHQNQDIISYTFA